MSNGIRQVHRWVSILLVMVVAGIFAAQGFGEKPAMWVYLSPLLPLALLALTGLYMFVLPYMRKGTIVSADGKTLPTDREREEALKALRKYRGAMPKDFKFNRDEAHERD
jgi:hypothetical protein